MGVCIFPLCRKCGVFLDEQALEQFTIDNCIAIDVTRVKGGDYDVEQEKHLGKTVRRVRNRVNREIHCDQ